MHVTRAEVDEDFWTRLRHEAQAGLEPSTIEEAALRVWTAIEGKRLYAHPDEVLALNAVRTPWLALPSVVAAFRRQHGADARGIGFKEIWIVGASEAFTERLDVT